MIEPIRWPQRKGEPSPFERAKPERRLRITFHSSTLVNLPSEEQVALEALFELCYLSEIEALQIGAGQFPRIEIGSFNIDADHIPVTVTDRNNNRSHYVGIFTPRQWFETAQRLAQRTSFEQSETEAMLSDLLVARAHCALAQDVLVTGSSRLLNFQTEPSLREANPRTPSEAAKIIGLFLRCRGNFCYRVLKGGKETFDRGLFYWVLTRQKLPSLWRYFSACVEAKKIKHDDILYLGQSVLERCNRAVQARDAIGEQFYRRQGNNARDTMMYHFDYLTVLLAGALDAQARITYRAYGIKKPDERYVSFPRSNFVQALGQHGATALYQLVSAEYSRAVLTMIFTLRHTIHGAALNAIAYGTPSGPDSSFVQVPNEHVKPLWEAAEQSGSLEKWGLKKDVMFIFEPYTYACTLVEEGLRLVDAIAKTTDVQGLFPKDYSIPPLIEKPPDDGPFVEHIRERLAVLG